MLRPYRYPPGRATSVEQIRITAMAFSRKDVTTGRHITLLGVSKAGWSAVAAALANPGVPGCDSLGADLHLVVGARAATATEWRHD